MSKKNLDYERDFAIPIGAFVQANEENKPTNGDRARTIDGIYLRPLSNRSGGHKIMNIVTGAVMTRPRVWEIPITETVIQAMENLAYKQGIKSLKLTGKNKTQLLPNDWVEGVQYEYDDDNYDKDTDGYDYDNDNDDDIDDDEQYDAIEQDEIDHITNDNDNNNNDEDEPAPIEEGVADKAAAEEVNNKQNEDEQAEEPAIGPAIVPDDNTVGSNDRPTRERAKPEKLTYKNFNQKKKNNARKITKTKKNNVRKETKKVNLRRIRLTKRF